MTKREAILARLSEIIGEDPTVGISGVYGYRNRGEVSSERAIIMHDGPEQAEDAPERPRGSAIDFVVATPQIFIVAGDAATDIGTTLNDLLGQLQWAVLSDPTLDQLCGTNGEMRYLGCGTVTEAGEQREGVMEVSFSFRYLFKLQDLAP